MTAPTTSGAAGQIAALHRLEGAHVYDRLSRDDILEVRDVLLAARDAGPRVLDLACGSGWFTIPLALGNRRGVALEAGLTVDDVTGLFTEAVSPCST